MQSRRIRPNVAIILTSVALGLPAFFACGVNCLAQSKSFEPQRFSEFKQKILDLSKTIDNKEVRRQIATRLIGLEYRLADKEKARKEWSKLVDAILEDIESESERPHFELYQQQVQISGFIGSIAGLQARVGNSELALSAIEKVEVFRFASLIGAMQVAAEAGDSQLVEQLFKSGRSNEQVQADSRRVFGASLESTFVHAQILLGNYERALEVVGYQIEESISSMPSPFEQKIDVAVAALRNNRPELARKLLPPILKSLDDNTGALNYKTQFVKAHMAWVRLHPEQLRDRLAACETVLKNHQGVNGPQGGCAMLAIQLAQMGEGELAMQYIERLSDDAYRQHILLKVAEAQADNGFAFSSLGTIELIDNRVKQIEARLSASSRLERNGFKQKAIQVFEGLPELALTLDDIQRRQLRIEFFETMAQLQLELGSIDQELEWIEQLNESSTKAICLLRVEETRLLHSED